MRPLILSIVFLLIWVIVYHAMLFTMYLATIDTFTFQMMKEIPPAIIVSAIIGIVIAIWGTRDFVQLMNWTDVTD